MYWKLSVVVLVDYKHQPTEYSLVPVSIIFLYKFSLVLFLRTGNSTIAIANTAGRRRALNYKRRRSRAKNCGNFFLPCTSLYLSCIFSIQIEIQQRKLQENITFRIMESL